MDSQRSAIILESHRTDTNGVRLTYVGMNETFDVISYDWDRSSQENMETAKDGFDHLWNKVRGKKKQ